MRRRLEILLVAVVALVGCGRSAPGPDLWVFVGETMGTTYEVKVVAEGIGEERRVELADAIVGVLDEVNGKMSTWLKESEVSRLNRVGAREPFAVSPETFEVLALSKKLVGETRGAFDMTVGPLVDAWGFGPAGRQAEPPGEEELAGLLERTGSELLDLDAASLTVTKGLDQLRVDLSGVAKGYAVDRISEALAEAGAGRHMVEVGGEVRTRGLNQQAGPWRIAIQMPDLGGQRHELVVPLSDLAMATSGDYRNYYEVAGRRVSHTIDPRTGRPIEHNLASVSVVATDCARADGLATGLNVLGPEGVSLAEELGVAAYFLFREADGEFSRRMTPAFAELFESEALE